MPPAERKPSPRATLRKVAREAGVHTATASRALSSDPAVRDSVAAPTRERVLQTAERLGYRRNRAGASLRTGRTGTIGVLVPRISDIVVALVYEGLDAKARELGYTTLVASTFDEPATRRERIQEFLEHGVDAIVYCDAHHDEPGGLESAFPVPVLPFMRQPGSPLPGTPLVDDAGGGRQMGQHLVELGHQEIGVLAGPEFTSTARARTGGFVDECASRGVPIPAERIVHSPLDVVDGKWAAAHLLDRAPEVTALFAVNDFLAIGAMGTLRSRGLQAPRDVAVAGFNDVPAAAELLVPLTSVHSPLVDVGAATAQHALAAIADERLEMSPFATSLRARESTLGPRN